MDSTPYQRNHYVPEWYQRRFLPEHGEKKFFYLDMTPEMFLDSKGTRLSRTAPRRWGSRSCFKEDDLYTTRWGTWESTEIEEKFFGRIDERGKAAVEYFASFSHPSADGDAFNELLLYMSTQKLRTPKGLSFLSFVAQATDKNALLILMQQLRAMHCAIWTECIWSIADASESNTKFIISDHPVTVYNRDCSPISRWCRDFHDPDITHVGTHTLFPLSPNKILIFTNLSWVRDPYRKGVKLRPNPSLFRSAFFNFMEIQTGRKLTEVEVNEINFIIKKRAYRYIAAACEEWLYPEKHIPSEHWRNLGGGYLLMPDPRSVVFGGEVLIGYENKRVDAFDAYGRKPWQEDYSDKELADQEWKTFHAFQGEFARLFGPRRRGRTFQFDQLDNEEDPPDYHQYHLELERKYGV